MMSKDTQEPKILEHHLDRHPVPEWLRQRVYLPSIPRS